MSAVVQTPVGDIAAALAALDADGSGTDDSAADDGDRAARLAQYLDLLQRWNGVYNLTAITDRAQMITHHLLDSMAIVAPLDQVLGARETARILDAGTGAGLPGIVLAIARPRWHLTLVDSNSKKIAFVTQAIAELRLSNCTAITGRVEQRTGRAYDVVVSRAFASLVDFTASTRGSLREDGVWAAMKGLNPRDEVAALPDDVRVIDIVPLHVPGLGAERHLILMKAA